MQPAVLHAQVPEALPEPGGDACMPALHLPPLNQPVTCHVRGSAISTDGGSTFTPPLEGASELWDPNCQASVSAERSSQAFAKA